MTVRILHGDCRRVMRLMAARGVMVDSVVCDPPYHLASIVKRFGAGNAAPAKDRDGLYKRASAGFMGKQWDGGDIAFDPETWALVWRVLKPGGHLLAFGGTRGWHRMACAIEDAGFEIRDTVAWLYGSGFPKSHDVAKGIDKTLGAKGEVAPTGDPVRRIRPGADQNKDGSWEKLTDRTYQPGEYMPATPEAEQWQGFGTALKPAFEPIVLARKPLSEKSIAANVLKHGTGAINVDGCRVATGDDLNGGAYSQNRKPSESDWVKQGGTIHCYAGRDYAQPEGRWPANVCHDGSPEVEAAFAAYGDRGQAGPEIRSRNTPKTNGIYGAFGEPSRDGIPHDTPGTAARFFYSASTNEEELLLWRAKAIIEQWNQELANTADGTSSLSSEVAVSVLRDAVIWASRGGTALIQSDCQEPSTSVTPSELRRIVESATVAILSIEQKSWLALGPENITANVSHVRFAATRKPTGTITITISHWKSDGSAAPVTFNITPTNSEPGAKDLKADNRFYYSSKADKVDRLGSKHPTVKPVDLMRWLVRLVTPPKGIVLDPFAGTGTTGQAAIAEGMRAILIEREAEYVADIQKRLAHVRGDDTPLFSAEPALFPEAAE